MKGSDISDGGAIVFGPGSEWDETLRDSATRPRPCLSDYDIIPRQGIFLEIRQNTQTEG